MHPNIERILIDETTLKKRIAEMAAEISKDYEGEEVLVIGLLKGAAYFMMELTQHMTVPTQIDFLKVSSYGSGTSTTGKVDIHFDTSRNVANKNVLIVDDVCDSGLTLKAVRDLFAQRNCKSIRLAAMLDKKERRLVKMVPDYYGFVIPDEFVVGFGLDYDEDYRTLPYIGILKRSVYDK
jgi:hypoxanthine phosphoribosyltransferase